MKNKRVAFTILFLFSITAMNLTNVTILETEIILDTEFKAKSNVSIAYIYNTDIDKANDYKSLLDPNGFSTVLMNLTDINSKDQLLPYSLIILGGDLPYYNVDVINALNDSLRPIIGLAYGGYTFFKNLSLEIVSNIVLSIPFNPPSMVAVNSSHPIFNTPHLIPNASITPYSCILSYSQAAIPSPSPDMLLICKHSTISDYYPIVAQKNKYVFWGYGLGPMNMTTDGKNLFLNIVNYFMVTISSDGDGVPGFELYFLSFSLITIVIFYLIRKKVAL